MASTVTARGTTWTTTAGNKTVVATPAAGDLIVVIAASTGVATTAVTDTQSGTYVQVDSTRTGFSTSGNLTAWVRTALIPAASSTTWTATQTSSTGGGLTVISASGMSLTGAAAVRSSGGQSTGSAATTPAPVLSLTPLSSNPIIVGFGNATGTTTNVVQRTGYTEDFDNGYGTPTTGFEVSHLASGETSATLTFGGTSSSNFATIAIELQFTSSPTVALNTPADTATGVSTTPDLAFTGTDADSDAIEYEVQVDTVNTFSSSGASTYTYNESNVDSSVTFRSGSSNTEYGQAFTATANGLLTSAKFVLSKSNSPTGTINAKIYASTGTVGTNATGTGTPLAVSDNFSASTLTTTLTLSTFTFSGSNQISLLSGVDYVVVMSNTNSDSVNVTNIGIDSTTPTASGNKTSYNGTSWSSQSTVDVPFYVVTSGGPLLDKLSVIPNATFTDITNGANTHPFPSGEQVKYTVQAGDTLTASIQYFWRVRGTDPSGTNAYGAWPSTSSFTTGASGVNATIAQLAATITVADGGGTTVSTVNIATVAQSAATITATGGTQTAGVNVAITQVAAAITATGGTQAVATVNNVALVQLAATVTTTGGTQAIATINNSAITQLAATVTATGGTQTAVTKASIAQLAATITAAGGTQTVATVQIVAITQVGATVTASGGTQTIATVNNVAISQLAATITATGGTQTVATVQNTTVTQLAASITTSGGTQVVTGSGIVSVSIAQVGAAVTASGGTQVVTTVNNVSLYQSSALYIDGVTGHGQGTIATASSVTSSSPVTLAIWFQLGADGTNTAASNALITYRYWYIHVRGTTNQAQVRFDETIAHVTTGAVLGTGNRTWHLVIGRYTPTGGSNWTMDLFQDGTKTTSSGTVLPTTLANATGYDLGFKSGVSATVSLNRALIYNRAISDQEASDLWTGNTVPTSPEGKFELNEGSGALAVDSSSNGQTSGSLTKGYAWVNGLGLLPSATGTATGGTQTIATVNDVSIVQLAATVTATGGAQTVATVNNVAIAQLAGTVTASGGAQSISTVRNASVSQTAATVTASGGTQVVASSQNVSIVQLSAAVTARGGTQVVTTSRYVSLVQFAASLVATGGVQLTFLGSSPAYRLLRGSRGHIGPRQVTQPRTNIGQRQVRSPRGVKLRGNTDPDKV